MKASDDRDSQLSDRRRHPRAEVAWRIVLEHEGGFQWRGETVALSPFGAKVRLVTKAPGPEAGSLVRLHFSPPDGKPAMTLKGLVWRVDAGDAVVVFSNLSSKEFLRLKYLTDRVLGTQPAALSSLRPAR